MTNNFTTNNKTQKTLKGRLNMLIGISDKLKFLVGFFYFFGYEALLKSLQANPHVQIKLLASLQVDRLLHQMVEHGNQETGMSQDDHFQRFH